MIKKILNSGFLLVPIVFIALFFGIREIKPDIEYTSDTILMMLGGSVGAWLLSWTTKTSDPRYQNETYSGLEAAKRPPVPETMLYKEPTGFCFGTYKGRYVCKKIDEFGGGILVTGGSGTGKSASIIQGFLLNPENKKNCNTLTLDLKHELVDKTVLPDERYSPENTEGRSIVIDFDRRIGYGFNPLYALTEDSSALEIHSVMELIAQCLIPIPKGENAVWSISAQQFLRGCLTYFYKEERMRKLPDIISAILSSSVKDLVEKIVGSAMPGSPEYADMITFHDMSDDTIMSVSMNLSQKIVQFTTNPDLIWCLGDNPRKCSPKDLLERNIFLCIPEDQLQQMGQLVFLIFNMTISYIMGLPQIEQEPERKRMALILDETVALLAGVGAPMPLLSQFLRLGARGHGCTMLICCQSISGLYQTMDRDQTRDMISNCAYKYILDSSDSETSREIVGWCGKYLKRKVSSSGAGTQQKNTVSFENEDIIREQDLMSLPQSGDIILVSNRAGYLRLQKCLVFKDTYFKKLLEAVKLSKSESEVSDHDRTTASIRTDGESSTGAAEGCDAGNTEPDHQE